MPADVRDQQRVAQIGLVAAVFEHRFLVRDAHELAGRGHRFAVGELLEHAGQHRLDRREHVVLRHEAHLEIELVEFAGRAVGARVLVAEAGRDLEIAVEARDHDQLLEHLRRLRERVELARVHPARHQIIARALGAAGRQDRRLELGEALVDHPPPDRSDHRRAQQHVGVQTLAAKVEVAVFEPDILGIFGIAGDRHRQFRGGRLDVDGACDDLDLAGRQLRVHHVGRPGNDLAGHRHHRFDAQRFEGAKHRAVGVGDDLGNPVMVAQIDEQQPAMVALAVDPARQPHRVPDVGGAQLGAAMSAVGVHGLLVIPAKAGISGQLSRSSLAGVPAFAGTTRAFRSTPLLSTREGAAMAPDIP